MIGKFNKRWILTLVVALVLISTVAVYAQEEEAELVIESNTLSMGTSTTVTLTINDNTDLENIGLRGLDDFEVMTSSQSSSTQIINGTSTFQYQYHITLMPKSVGEFTLQGVLTYKDKTVETNPITVKVSEEQDYSSNEGEAVFLTTSLSKEDAFFGEELVLTYKLFTRYNLDGLGFTEDVVLDSFLVNELDSSLLNTNYTTIDGNQYLVYEVAKYILSPTTLGEIIIPPFQFQANISSGSMFEPSKPMYLESDEVRLEVQMIPDVSKPDNYYGLIGELEVNASYDTETIQLGEPVSLSVTISGIANLNSIESLYQKEIENVTVYETVIDDSISYSEQGVFHSKTFEVIIIPKKSGEINFPELEIPFFDTRVNGYVRTYIPGTVITVEGASVNGEDENIEEHGNTSIGDSGVENGKMEVIKIHQISVDDLDDSVILIRVQKKYLPIIGGVLVLALMVLVMWQIYKKQQKKPRRTEYKAFIKKINRVKTKEHLGELLDQLTDAEIGYNRHVLSQKELLTKIRDVNKQASFSILIDAIDSPEVTVQDAKAKFKEFLRVFYMH